MFRSAKTVRYFLFNLQSVNSQQASINTNQKRRRILSEVRFSEIKAP